RLAFPPRRSSDLAPVVGRPWLSGGDHLQLHRSQAVRAVHAWAGAIAAGESHLGRYGGDAYVTVAGARQGAAIQPQPPANTRASVRKRAAFRGSARCSEAGEHAGGPRLRWPLARGLEQRARTGGFL